MTIPFIPVHNVILSPFTVYLVLASFAFSQMEDNHQSRKRRHAHGHESEHLEPRKHHKHHNHHSTSPRHDRILSPKTSVEKRPPLVIRDRNELSAGRDYVRNWLAHTQNEDIIEPPKQFNAELGRQAVLVYAMLPMTICTDTSSRLKSPTEEIKVFGSWPYSTWTCRD